MEKEILILIEKLTRIAEEYGAYSYANIHPQRLETLRNEYNRIMEDLRKKLLAIRQPQQLQAPAQPYAYQQAQLIAKNLFMKTFLDALETPEEEPEDTKIEFSL